MDILLAIILGTFFGFALNRVGATNPQYIINMLRLTNLHLMKTILLAIGVSSLALFIGLGAGIFEVGHLSIKASYIGVVIGGAILGIGFAIAGYCPGTGLAAWATGRRDARSFVIGGLLGAFVFSLCYSAFENMGWMDDIFGGKATLADTGLEGHTVLLASESGWITAVIIAVIIIGIAAILPDSLRKDR